MASKRRRPARAGSCQLDLFAVGSRTPTQLSRATAKRGRSVEAPAPRPWECVVLAIDTARRSGYAVYARGQLGESGEFDTLDNEPTLERVVTNAVERADSLKLPIVLVLEAPYGGSVEVIAALGVARERWLREWRRAGQAPARVVKVMPSQWRGPVLGSAWVGQPREAVRAQEMLVAKTLVKFPPGPDEAAAILIGRWGAHAARVGRAIGKRAAKASLRAWTARTA